MTHTSPQATSHKPQERSSGQRTHLVTLRCISYGLAIVLLIAALLKIHLLLTDPLATLKAGRPVWLLWLASLAELSVAWLSVHCKSHQAIWLANVLISEPLRSFRARVSATTVVAALARLTYQHPGFFSLILRFYHACFCCVFELRETSTLRFNGLNRVLAFWLTK